MSITFDQATSAKAVGSAIAVTITLAANAALLVFAVNDSSQTVSAMAYNGVALTKLGLAGNNGAELWVLSAPSSGANTLSVNWAGTGNNIGVIGVSYTHVKNIAGFGTAVSAVPSASNVSLSISSTSTDLVVVGWTVNSNTVVTATNGTTRASLTSGASLRIVIADITGAATVSVSATAAASAAWGNLAIPLVFSATVVANIYTLSLLGCGQ